MPLLTGLENAVFHNVSGRIILSPWIIKTSEMVNSPNIFSNDVKLQSSHSVKWQESSQSRSLHQNLRVEECELLTSF